MSEQSPYDASTGGLPRLAKPAADTRKLRQELSYAQARLIEVAADRDRLAGELATRDAMMTDMADTNAKLRAELSAARADAERYRWLRSFAGRTPELPDFDEPKSPEHMDAMIDAARATPSAEGN